MRHPKRASLLYSPTRSAAPRELKSTYRVIPDDAQSVSEAPAPEPNATPAAEGRADARRSAVWLFAAIAFVAAALASVVYFRNRTRRPLAHEARVRDLRRWFVRS